MHNVMRGTLSTTGVHDLAHANQPEFVAMPVKQPEVRKVFNKSLITIVRGEIQIWRDISRVMLPYSARENKAALLVK